MKPAQRIEAWPIVPREALVRAFRPGEEADREGPFRTLRQSRCATAGVRVALRKGGHASGSLNVFSRLNVEAALLKRNDQDRDARAFARAAEELESGQAFAALRDALLQCSPREATGVLAGDLPHAAGDVLGALTQVAMETQKVRHQLRHDVQLREWIAGVISASEPTYVVLTPAAGNPTAIPRWLAKEAHREKVGEFLVLAMDHLAGPRAIMEAFPGIALEEPFSPFARGGSAFRISASDAKLLSRAPAPLKVVVPVTLSS